MVWPGMPFPNLDGRIHQSLVLFLCCKCAKKYAELYVKSAGHAQKYALKSEKYAIKYVKNMQNMN